MRIEVIAHGTSRLELAEHLRHVAAVLTLDASPGRSGLYWKLESDNRPPISQEDTH